MHLCLTVLIRWSYCGVFCYPANGVKLDKNNNLS